MTDPTMSAQEAADALGVSVATLYAYVSRGLVRSEAEGRSRARRYRREDVEALLTRKEQRKEPEKVAETALNWGAPVLESSLSLIRDGRLYYRGREAVGLARAWSFERLAAFLWTGDAEAAVFEPPTPAFSVRARAVLGLVEDLPIVERFEVMLPVLAAEDWAAYDTRPTAVAQTGARLVAHLTTMASGSEAPTGSVAASLAAAWAPDQPGAAAALDAALILAADHELNVSAFTARCVASAGSTPYAVVTAGLAALRGPKHGGHCDRVEALFAEAGSPRMAAATLAGRLRRGEAVPGFGQPLYPQGDPRGAALLALAAEVAPGSGAVALATALAEAARSLLHEHPTIDFGLVALARALGLPPGAPIAIFALGRSVGWIAHAIEQYQADRLIRPRARYVGLPPEA
ncbi:Citrate synthase 2 [compost metagenome]